MDGSYLGFHLLGTLNQLLCHSLGPRPTSCRLISLDVSIWLTHTSKVSLHSLLSLRLVLEEVAFLDQGRGARMSGRLSLRKLMERWTTREKKKKNCHQGKYGRAGWIPKAASHHGQNINQTFARKSAARLLEAQYPLCESWHLVFYCIEHCKPHSCTKAATNSNGSNISSEDVASRMVLPFSFYFVLLPSLAILSHSQNVGTSPRPDPSPWFWEGPMIPCHLYRRKKGESLVCFGSVHCRDN